MPFWFHLPPTLKNFRVLFYQTDYGVRVVNIMAVAACVVAITLLTAVPAGYALARLRLPGAENTGIAMRVVGRPGIALAAIFAFTLSSGQ
jgi:multiple sugar transport system permease protein